MRKVLIRIDGFGSVHFHSSNRRRRDLQVEEDQRAHYRAVRGTLLRLRERTGSLFCCINIERRLVFSRTTFFNCLFSEFLECFWWKVKGKATLMVLLFGISFQEFSRSAFAISSSFVNTTTTIGKNELSFKRSVRKREKNKNKKRWFTHHVQ